MTTALAGWLMALLVAGAWMVVERRRGVTRAARLDRLTARADRELIRWLLAKDRQARAWLGLVEDVQDLQAREAAREEAR